MKRIALTLIAGLALAFTACKKECPYYMEGENCDTEVREKYYGTYVGTSTIGSQTQNTYFIVSPNAEGPEYIKLSEANAKLVTANEFDIPYQLLYSNGNTYQIEGEGSFNGSLLNVSIVWTFGGTSSYSETFQGTKN